jgi:hypothetical protein
VDSPTQTLLLTLSRGSLSESERTQARQLMCEAARVDWSRLAELASLHGVVGLVRHNLLALDARPFVPDPVWHAVEQAATQIAFDGMLRLRQTLQAVDALQSAGIEPILLKGYALAALLYDDPIFRPSTDIDLLIRRSEVDAACSALERIGGRLPSRETAAVQFASSYDLPVMMPSASGKAGLLELHWDLAPRGLFSLDLDAWRARSGEFQVEGLTALRFSPEDMLLHLALHMRKHRYVGLRWLCDVAELVRRHTAELDWRYVLTSAQRAGLRVLLYTSLQLAERLLQAPVDADILRQLEPSALRRSLLRSVLTQDALLLPVERDEAGWTQLAPAEVLLLDRPGAMARELGYRLAPPSEAMLGADAAGMTSSQRLFFGVRRLANRTTRLFKRP